MSKKHVLVSDPKIELYMPTGREASLLMMKQT